jgi:predicted extracellular nuclease
MKEYNEKITPIGEVQGSGLWSEIAGQTVTVQGVVTAMARRGFFLQSVHSSSDPLVSDAIFVFSPRQEPPIGALVNVSGKVMDFFKQDNGKPVTQVKLDSLQVIKRRGPVIEPFELTADNVPEDPDELAIFLNGLEGMLVSITPGQTFIAPSNRYGDYVLILDADRPVQGVVRSEQGGVLIDHQNPLRWYPGFRMKNYKDAPCLNVGSRLLSRVVGPLNYRVESYQILVNHPVKVEHANYPLTTSRLKPEAGFITIMTMNGFNLDAHVESRSMVKNPYQDVDDDWGEGRFQTLAEAVVLQANVPDIVALQEIQDNDGAEISMVVDASLTYQTLIREIEELSGVSYHWVDIAPGVGADGGQPGGSIRNGYLYNPSTVELKENSVRSIGVDDPAFEGSRKPLVVHFRDKVSGKELACVNIHLASKRHQYGIFAPELAGHDDRLPVRIRQATAIRDELKILRQQGLDYYVTGDFNDTEESKTLAALVGDENVNLVDKLLPEHRYDYNHRGKLQVLMHGVVSSEMAGQRAEYDIIHGNELLGVKPGQSSDKPSDHAYVMAKIKMQQN